MVGLDREIILTAQFSRSTVLSIAILSPSCAHTHAHTYTHTLSPHKIGISLGVVCPVYVFYVVIAGWFFSHAAMETMLILFRRHNLSQNVCKMFLVSRDIFMREIAMTRFRLALKIPRNQWLKCPLWRT